MPALGWNVHVWLVCQKNWIASMYWVFNFLVIYVKVNVEKRKGFENFY